jgi:hypothetical protein
VDSLRRRDLLRISISTAGLVVANGCGLLPFAARPSVARIGYLWSGSAQGAYLADALRDGLRAAGWVEGKNLIIEERWLLAGTDVALSNHSVHARWPPNWWL